MQREDIRNFHDLRQYLTDKMLRGEIIVYSQNAETVQKFMYAQGMFCPNQRVYVFIEVDKKTFFSNMLKKFAKTIENSQSMTNPKKIIGIEIIVTEFIYSNVILKVYDHKPKKVAEIIANKVIALLHLHGIWNNNLKDYLQQITISPAHDMNQN